MPINKGNVVATVKNERLIQLRGRAEFLQVFEDHATLYVPTQSSPLPQAWFQIGRRPNARVILYQSRDALCV